MDNPLDTLTERLDSLAEHVVSEKPIDYRKVARVQALDVVRAGVYYTRDAINRMHEADGTATQDGAPPQ